MNNKITFFSDTHALHRKLVIPKSDILIFGGDLMTDGYTYYEIVDFLNWFEEQPSEHKIFIAGNHDRLFETNKVMVDCLLQQYPSIIYLENKGININGINFWGTPNSKMFYNWAFNNSSDELKRIFSEIPESTDILISHAPQYGLADELSEPHGHVGEPELTEQIAELPNLKYHLVGHIHKAYGVYGGRGDFWTINGAVTNEQYKVVNKPISFYL